jgi:hypothetical protein
MSGQSALGPILSVVNRFTIRARPGNITYDCHAQQWEVVAQEFRTERFQLAAAVRVTDQELLLCLVKEEAA